MTEKMTAVSLLHGVLVTKHILIARIACLRLVPAACYEEMLGVIQASQQ